MESEREIMDELRGRQVKREVAAQVWSSPHTAAGVSLSPRRLGSGSVPQPSRSQLCCFFCRSVFQPCLAVDTKRSSLKLHFAVEHQKNCALSLTATKFVPGSFVPGSLVAGSRVSGLLVSSAVGILFSSSGRFRSLPC